MKSVSVAIIKYGEHFILGRRRDRKKRRNMDDRWEFPAGKIEKGETPEQAVVREVMEELNLTVRVEKKLDLFPSEGHKFCIHVFLCVLDNLEDIADFKPDSKSFYYADFMTLDQIRALRENECIRGTLKIMNKMMWESKYASVRDCGARLVE